MKPIFSTMVLVLAGVGPAAAQVTLQQDFDTGALDVPGSVIDLTDPTRPVITLEPRRFTGAWPGNHWWVFFSAHGVAGRTPRFRLPTAGAFQAYTNQHRWVWSATPLDPLSWTFFDQGFVDGNGFFRSQNNAPFTANVVWVAYAIPYTFGRTAARTASLIGHPLVRPTASSDANLVLGMTPGTAGGGYTDDLGRAVPALPLYGYRITDGSGGPKKKIVVLAGNHSGEPTGSWTLEGFVDFVLGDSPSAVLLRSRADVFVYPEVDPEGRTSGYFRSNPENPALNHNTEWADPTGYTDITLVREAMLADTGGEAFACLDFHGFGSATESGYLAPTSNPQTAVFLQTLLALEPELQDFTVPNPQPIATAARWAAAPSGLSADIAVTPEAGSLAGEGVGRYHDLGQRYARAVLAAIVGEPRVRPPGSGREFLEHVLRADPELYLAFDEQGGSVALDSSGHVRNGSYVGAVSRSADTAFVSAPRRALKLEGNAGSPSGEYVRVGDFAYGAGGDFTLAFWFRTSAIAGSSEQHVFSHGALAQASSLNVFFEETPFVGSGDRLRTVVLDSNDPTGYANALDVALAPADGDWHFYTLAVAPGAGATLYLDGFPVVSRPAIVGQVLDPAGDLFVGARSDLAAGKFYGRTGAADGFVDELVLLPHALSAAEVLELARSPLRLARQQGGLVSWSSAGILSVQDESGAPCDALVAARPAGDPSAEILLFVPARGLSLSRPELESESIVWEALCLPTGVRPAGASTR